MGGEQKHHVVLFPFMAQGHMNPFIALAEFIVRRRPDFKVTLVSTPLNIHNLQSSLPPNSGIQLRSIPFSPSDHGFPPGTETTAALPFHLLFQFILASESLRPQFEQLILEIGQEDGRLPSCIIADNFFAWTVEVAAEFGILHSIFITGGAYGSALLLSLWHHLPHALTAADDFPLPDFSNIRIHRSQLPGHLRIADGNDSWSIYFRRQIQQCFKTNIMLANTVQEFETTGLNMLRSITSVPVYPAGPLLWNAAAAAAAASPPAEANYIMKWLDAQPSASVLYISFGSQNFVNAEQMMELALGLEASGKAFVWAIRPLVGPGERLPEGFEERMQKENRGLLFRGWAPQLEILSHVATGAFLSHCGWNSVLESLSRGVPIIGWPLSAEQFYNAKMLVEEVGVCMEVARGNSEYSTGGDREAVRRVVQTVMGETAEGTAMRRNAAEFSQVLRGALEDGDGRIGSSVKAMEQFFHAIVFKRSTFASVSK